MWAGSAESADVLGGAAQIEEPGRSRAIAPTGEHRVPEAQRQHERLAEPKRRLDDAAGGVVLSPRVIDRLAFDEYVALLKSEIDGATRESELLARRAEAGAVILDQLERFMTGNGDAIEHAAEVLAGIDQRMAGSRALLDEVERRSVNLSKASQSAEQAIEARAEAFQSRLRSIVDTAMDRFEETEDQLTARAASARRELLDRLEQMRSRGEDTLSRLDARATNLAAEAEDTTARAEARLDALRGPAREVLASIEAKVAAFEALADERLSAFQTSATEIASSLDQAQQLARTERDAIAEAAASGREEATKLMQVFDDLVEQRRATIETLLTDLSDRAETLTDRGVGFIENAAERAAETITRSAETASQAEATLTA
ncbi:MAG: hypothetical protein AAFY46_12050, partial [Planctomycetota bacterium]